MWGLFPWLFAALCFTLMMGMARYARRRAGAQFVVLRGRVSCPECSYLLDLDDKHCAKCGYSVAQVKSRVSCPECRARNWDDDVFCRQCGHRMPEASDGSGPGPSHPTRARPGALGPE